MAEFDLDLQAAEDYIEDATEGSTRVVLAELDGTTPDEEWIEEVGDGAVLLLSVEGDINELAAGFAREVRDAGGELVRFRGFLVVAPPGVTVDTDRLD